MYQYLTGGHHEQSMCFIDRIDLTEIFTSKTSFTKGLYQGACAVQSTTESSSIKQKQD